MAKAETDGLSIWHYTNRGVGLVFGEGGRPFLRPLAEALLWLAEWEH